MEKKVIKSKKSEKSKAQKSDVEKMKNSIFNNPVTAKVFVRIATIFSSAIVLVILFLIVSSHIHNTYFSAKKEIKSGMVDRQLLVCQELVSEKYRYSDIITLKKSILFSKSYSIVKFTGIIRAGLSDVSKIEYKISGGGKKIRLTIPKAEILGNDIVEQSVFDEKRSLFVPITVQEIFTEIDTVRNDIAEEICGEGFLDEADISIKRTIKEMMYALGFEEVIIQ